jgi:predicted transcriptional regulator
MSDRQLVLDAVQEMPETASLHEIVDELLLLDEVKRRLAKSERGERGVPHEEVAKMLDSWITK